MRIENKTMFADPYTRILHPVATVVTCSDINPIRWKIGGRWYCGTPQLHACQPPTRLNLTTSVTEPFEDFTEGVGYGLFSPEQMRRHAVFQASMSSRKAVTQGLTNAAVEGAHGGYPGNPLSSAHLDTIKNKVGSFFFPLFPLVGEAWYTIVTVMMALTALRMFLSGLLRFLILYGERGCGCWMLAAVSETLFQVARTPVDIIWTIMNQVLRDDDDDDPEDRQGHRGSGGHHGGPPPPPPPPAGGGIAGAARRVSAQMRTAGRAARRLLQPKEMAGLGPRDRAPGPPTSVAVDRDGKEVISDYREFSERHGRGEDVVFEGGYVASTSPATDNGLSGAAS